LFFEKGTRAMLLRTVLSTDSLGTSRHPYVKNEPQAMPHMLFKNSTKCNSWTKVKCKTIELVEENRNSNDFELGKDLLQYQRHST
jgi:hypothetical protein